MCATGHALWLCYHGAWADRLIGGADFRVEFDNPCSAARPIYQARRLRGALSFCRCRATTCA